MTEASAAAVSNRVSRFPNVVRPNRRIGDTRPGGALAPVRLHTGYLAVPYLPLLVFLAYTPVVYLSYGVMDDFASLVGLESKLVLLRVQGGRPVYGALLWLGTSVIPPQVEWLVVYRVLAVVALMVFAVLTARWLERLGWHSSDAVFVGLMAGCLAPMQVYASWAVAWVAPLACCLSTVAVLLVHERRGTGVRSGRTPRMLRMVAAFTLIVVALSTYQPSAMVYFAMLIPWVCGAASEPPSRRRAMATAAAVGLLAMGAYALLVIALQSIYGAQNDGRVLHVPNSGTLEWFLTVVVPVAAELWRVEPGTLMAPGVGLVVAVAAAAGLLAAIRSDDRWPALRLLTLQATVVGGLFLLSYSPVLMVSEQWPSRRSQGALVVAMLMIFAVGLRRLLAARDRRVLTSVLGVLALVAAISVARNTLIYYAVPQTIEWRLLRAELQKQRDAITRSHAVHILRPAWWQSAAPLVQYDEFGFPSMSSRWVPDPMVREALRAIGVDSGSISVTHSMPGEPPPADGRPVINMRQLEKWR